MIDAVQKMLKLIYFQTLKRNGKKIVYYYGMADIVLISGNNILISLNNKLYALYQYFVKYTLVPLSLVGVPLKNVIFYTQLKVMQAKRFVVR